MKKGSSIFTLTKENFDETILDNPLVLVDFWAEWCGPCRAFSEIYQQAALKYPEIIFGSVNVEEEPELAQDFGVQAIPLLMVFRGEVAVYKESGALTLSALETIIRDAQSLDLTDIKTQIANQEKK